MKSGRETRLWAGKRNSSPCGMWSVGSARGSESGEHDMPVKAIRQEEGMSPSYGLRFGSPWPSRGREPVHAKNRACHCSSFHGVPPTSRRGKPCGRSSDPSAHGFPRVQAPMHRPRGPPGGYPKQNNCPFCPQFSTPPWDWGPPKSVIRSYTRFYTFGSALRHSRPLPIFCRFGRENFAVMPK
jgi:hypothetical protein